MKNRYLQGKKFHVYNEKLWIYDSKCNQLCSTDLDLTEAEMHFYIADEELCQPYYFEDIAKYKEKIFFIAGSADYNLQINNETGKQKKILSYRNNSRYGIKNSSIHQENNKIYMFPIFWGDNIVIYDFETEIIEELPIDYMKFRKKNINSEAPFWGKAYKSEDKIILPLLQENTILVIRDKVEKIYELDVNSEGFYSCYCIEDNIYILPIGNEDILSFNLATEETEKLLSKEMWKSANIPFSRIYIKNSTIYLVPAELDTFMIYDMNTKKLYTEYLGKNKYVDYMIYKERMYLAPAVGSACLIIDMEDFSFNQRECEIKDFHEALNNWIERMKSVSTKAIMINDDLCGLKMFTNNIKEMVIESNTVKGTCGRNILNEVL